MSRRTTAGQMKFISRAGERRLLSKGEVARLIKKAHDEALPIPERLKARNKIVEHNILLVSHWAHKYAGKHSLQHLKLEDLMQEGMEGLIRACETFDPDTGNAFSTYATWWINQKIRRAIHDRDRTVRLPVHKLEVASRVFQMKCELEANLNRPPTEEEFWEAFTERYSEEIVRKASFENDKLPPHTYSLNHVYASNGTGEDQERELMDILENEDDNPQEEVQSSLLHERLHHLIEGLDERSRVMLKMSYGIQPFDRKHTLREMGSRFGVSNERARQIKIDAEKHLAEIMDPRLDGEEEDGQPQITGYHTAYDNIDVGSVREEKGWSQQYLAQRAGVSQITVKRVERGDLKLSELNPEVKDRLAVQLELDVEAVLQERRSGDDTAA